MKSGDSSVHTFSVCSSSKKMRMQLEKAPLNNSRYKKMRSTYINIIQIFIPRLMVVSRSDGDAASCAHEMKRMRPAQPTIRWRSTCRCLDASAALVQSAMKAQNRRERRRPVDVAVNSRCKQNFDAARASSPTNLEFLDCIFCNQLTIVKIDALELMHRSRVLERRVCNRRTIVELEDA